ncbi:MAG: hypothetical protein NTU41_10305 [Chloroflexi bacterium]|nr:hypothetical protein [Chloroflexota bacterium]
MNKMLATWQAFRNKPGCQAAFLSNFGAIAALVKPLSNVTVSCDLDSGHVAEVYDKVRAMLCNSVVCTTKALHFFAPDLFIILDRMQVFSKWRRETQAAGNPLGGLIDGIDGARYTLFMNAVVKKLSGCFVEQLPVVLDGRSCGAISNVDQLRWCSPMMVASSGTSFPNTIGKALDNMIRSNDET